MGTQGVARHIDNRVKCDIVSLPIEALHTYPPIAQPVEQLPFKEKVPGSIPGGRTNLNEVKIWTTNITVF